MYILYVSSPYLGDIAQGSLIYFYILTLHIGIFRIALLSLTRIPLGMICSHCLFGFVFYVTENIPSRRCMCYMCYYKRYLEALMCRRSPAARGQGVVSRVLGKLFLMKIAFLNSLCLFIALFCVT